jgi:hypothetical protein
MGIQSIKAKEKRFFDYLFHLFTVDPYRKNASWRGFWLSDVELQALLRETFAVYFT